MPHPQGEVWRKFPLVLSLLPEPWNLGMSWSSSGHKYFGTDPARLGFGIKGIRENPRFYPMGRASLGASGNSRIFPWLHTPPVPLEFPLLPAPVWDIPGLCRCAQEFQGNSGIGSYPGPAVIPGSALAYSAYAFPLEWVGSTFHDFYVPVAVVNTVLSTGLSCYSRFLEAERPRLSKASRILAFVYPYIFDSIPIFYRLPRCAAGGCSEGSIRLHFRHSLCALLTFLILTSRLPERLAPGTFDLIGHSHQLFHVCGILGTHFQLEAVSMDMAERRGRLPIPSSLETFGSLGIGAAASLAILGICFLRLRPEPISREKAH
ncbi:PREDICTED: membrane progestin receptor gamma [Corvus brachyrhynchos]|nr:PREDICTED: membrane progestin receptor gamma [Corvus brachyrhynchos]